MELVKFEGNCPRNVAKEAKYSVRSDKQNQVIGIVYRDEDGAQWKPVSGDHPKLVEMVNEVKVALTGSRGGAFYINEYKQVLVPSSSGDEYYLAGEYMESLQFELHGRIFSGNAMDLSGQPLKPGDAWEGPHPGIPYVLCAGAKDIRYETEVMPRVTKKVHLSDVRDQATVSRVCQQIASVKGYNGGRFYINEFCQLFAPIDSSGYVDYQYIGRLGSLEDWFPKPHV